MSFETSLLINKQPIFNKNNTITAYQLSVDEVYTESDSTVKLSEEAFDAKLNTIYTDVEESGGFGLVTDNKPVFLKISAGRLKAELIPKINENDKITIEVDRDFIQDKQALQALKEIVKAGNKVALNLTDLEQDSKLTPFATAIKFSVKRFTPEKMQSILPQFSGKTIILTDIDSEDTLNSYLYLDIDNYQGFFYTEPVITAERVIDNNKLVLLKLLAEVNDPNIDFNDIVKTIQTDPVLSHKLISAINHPSNELPHIVDSLKEAVNVMGLKRMKFWVNLLVMSSVNDVPKELLVTALIRAKFLETLSVASGNGQDADKFFMVGLFSTLNAFMKISMSDIVEKISLSDDIKAALLEQQGCMGKALFVVKCLEQGNTQILSMGYENLGIMEVSSDYMKANGWAFKTVASLN